LRPWRLPLPESVRGVSAAVAKRDEHGSFIFKPEADLTPAFMRQAYTTAKLVATVDGMGTPEPISTQAILDGVLDLQEQLLIHLHGPEPLAPPKLEQVLRDVLRPMVDNVVWEHIESDNLSQIIYSQTREAADSVVEERIHKAAIIRESSGDTWARIATN